jgi:hypothetical protein
MALTRKFSTLLRVGGLILTSFVVWAGGFFIRGVRKFSGNRFGDRRSAGTLNQDVRGHNHLRLSCDGNVLGFGPTLLRLGLIGLRCCLIWSSVLGRRDCGADIGNVN